MSKIIHYLAEKPIVFNILRRIIEANYISIKNAIRKEFSLCHENEQTSPNEKILDVPCGTGEFCTLFKPNSYHGLDISKTYIEYAQKKYKQNFFCGDATRINFNDNYFDKILTLSLFHHIDDSSVKFVLKELKRILKPDGILLLIEDAPTSISWNFIGKVLQKLDIGHNIRTYSEYKIIAEEDFIIDKYYPIKSGFWDYSVFVLSPKKQDKLKI
ncbi:MAG: class I SAM-dependent methyltransferase [Nitrospirae bacterium]|nr:class I SAM-dependent methyltransferase [Nitrospirota bacterium]